MHFSWKILLHSSKIFMILRMFPNELGWRFWERTEYLHESTSFITKIILISSCLLFHTSWIHHVLVCWKRITQNNWAVLGNRSRMGRRQSTTSITRVLSSARHDDCDVCYRHFTVHGIIRYMNGSTRKCSTQQERTKSSTMTYLVDAHARGIGRTLERGVYQQMHTSRQLP